MKTTEFSRPMASRLPSGERAAEMDPTGRVFRHFGCFGFHSFSSLLIVTTTSLVGPKSTFQTLNVCPLNSRTSLLVLASQSLAVSSQLPVSIHFPSRQNEIEST